MTDREIMQQALEALEGIHVDNMTPMAEENWNKALTVLRQALAQPEQEPVAIHCPSCLHSFSIVPVAKREWFGLTDEEILSAAKEVPITCIRQRDYDLHFAPIIEAKLKKKNTK